MITLNWLSVPALIGNGLVILLAGAVLVSTALSLYLLLLAIAGLRRAPQVGAPGVPVTRFALLVPAHDEELVVGRLLASINKLDYPSHLREVHVIADHCSDQTAAIASSLGATVHERRNPAPQGKARALRWMVQSLLAGKAGAAIDAFVILDADSVVSPNFLRAMDRRLCAGEQLIQGLVRIDDPGRDPVAQLRALAYTFISHLRPLGRSALGLSVGLRGNGMCIAHDCAAQVPWNADSLAEDYDLHARLLAAGFRVAFAPEATVRTPLPQSRAGARTQSERWERGRLDTMRHQVPALLRHGLRRLAWQSIDGAIELIIPPFSVFAFLMLMLFGLSLLTGHIPLIVVAAIGLAAQGLYTLRGLALASASYPGIHRALLFAPAFVLWRVGLYLAVLTGRKRVQWVPTARGAARPSAPRRICIIRHYYYPEDPRSRREAEALAAAGHHVDILTLRHSGEPATDVINGVHVRRLPVKHYRGSLFHYAYEYGAFFVLALVVLTARFLRRRYDVVQVNSLPDFLVFATAGCKLLGARIVLDMHECTPELYCTKYQVSPEHPVVRLLGWIEQRSLAFADQVITCTPQQRDIFASRGTPPEKIAVVLNAANSAVFRPRTAEPVLWQPGGRFELVSHGLVAVRYGLDTMVHAVALLADEIPGIVLQVYGKGDYLPEMVALSSQLGIADRVIVHGFVPEEELLEGIARAHVGVIAAKRDSFRNLTHTQKMYEYVAMRKPVVIAETPAVRTHFDDSCFQFFTSDDPADLAQALRDLYHSPVRAVAMIEAAGECYRAYAWEAQRHIYCDAALGVTPEIAPAPEVAAGRKVAAERIAAAGAAALPAVAVSAIPVAAALDLSEVATSVEDGSIYLGSRITPETEVSI